MSQYKLDSAVTIAVMLQECMSCSRGVSMNYGPCWKSTLLYNSLRTSTTVSSVVLTYMF